MYDDGAGKDKYEGYNTSIATNDEMEEDEDEGLPVPQKRTSYTAPKSVMKEVAKVRFCIILKCIDISGYISEIGF